MSMWKPKILIFVTLAFYHEIKWSASYPVRTPLDCIAFLRHYGYLDLSRSGTGRHMTSAEALTMYQRFMGLPETGLPDEDTMKKMNKRRCDNPDVPTDMLSSDGDSGRKKRYVLISPPRLWSKKTVTYGITQYSEDRRLKHRDVIEQVDEAFKKWGDVTNIRFQRSTRGPVDIEIKFVKQGHGDSRGFDGPGEVLAHAFPPGEGLGGDVHFDDDERWDIRPIPQVSTGANFPWVVLHEIGHAVGLGHSLNSSSIMWPIEEEFSGPLRLTEDDIEGVQDLYRTKASLVDDKWGASFSSLPDATRIDFLDATGRPSGNLVGCRKPVFRPDLCAAPEIDAITELENGEIFAFSGYYAIRINGFGKNTIGDIGRMNSFFPSLNACDIDAAVTTSDGFTYIFKGRRVWKFRNFELQEDQTVPPEFAGNHANLDAAFRSGKQIYLIQGNNFIVRDEGSEKNIKTGKLSEMNIPDSKITSALDTKSGEVFLFNNDRFWNLKRRPDGSLMAESAMRKDTRVDLLQCKPKTKRRSSRGSPSPVWT